MLCHVVLSWKFWRQFPCHMLRHICQWYCLEGKTKAGFLGQRPGPVEENLLWQKMTEGSEEHGEDLEAALTHRAGGRGSFGTFTARTHTLPSVDAWKLCLYHPISMSQASHRAVEQRRRAEVAHSKESGP
jgi:hypothetical protein